MALNAHDEKAASGLGSDLENNTSNGSRSYPRVGGRIDGPKTKPINTGSESDSDLSIEAQIELEKDNAIKYRTCSWQMVRLDYCIPHKG